MFFNKDDKKKGAIRKKTSLAVEPPPIPIPSAPSYNEILSNYLFEDKNKLLIKEYNRLATFKNWKLLTTSKETLARIGFFYLGTLNHTQCFFCNLIVYDWKPEDKPAEKHRKLSPKCILLSGYDKTNEPIDKKKFKESIKKSFFYQDVGETTYNALTTTNKHQNISSNYIINNVSPYTTQISSQPSEFNIRNLRQEENTMFSHPKYVDENKRLDSFRDWPIGLSQKPIDLMEAGFFYTGNGDNVICYCCGIIVYHWIPSDDPFEKHNLFSKNCKYVKLKKGQRFLNEMEKNATNLKQLNLKWKEKDKEYMNKKIKQKELETSRNSKNSNKDKYCYMCLSNEYNSIFNPCGHPACVDCSLKVISCPICCKPFFDIIKMYI